MDTLPYLGGGALAVLVVVIGYLLRQNTIDRQDCRRSVAELERRYVAEVAARGVVEALIDVERQGRRHAEDIAYQLARTRGQPQPDPEPDPPAPA